MPGRFTATISRSTRSSKDKNQSSSNQPHFRSRKRQRTQPGPSIRIARDPEESDVHPDSDDDGFEDVNEDSEHEEGEEDGGQGYPTRRRAATATTKASGATSRTAVRRRDSLPRRTSPQASPSPRRHLHHKRSVGALSRKYSRHNLRKQASSSNLLVPPRTRTTKILSPLPTNHSLRRSTSAANTTPSLKNVERRPMYPKRAAANKKPVVGPPQTRTLRANGSGSGSSAGATRGTKRKRNVVNFREASTDVSDEEESEEEVEEFDDSEPEGEESGEEGSEEELEDAVAPLTRRLRSADLKHEDEQSEEEGSEEQESEDESEELEAEDDVSEDEESDVVMSAEDDHFHLTQASRNQLRRLRRPELARLYSIATEEHISTTATLTKDPLILGIVEARPESSPSASSEENEDSPRPFTSHEGSPEASRRRGGEKRGKGRKKRGDRRTHVPTPPPSSGASSEASATEEDSDEEQEEAESIDQRATRHRALRGRTQSLPYLQEASSTRRKVTRRGSQDVSTLRAPLQRRTRSHSNALDMDNGKKLRNGKSVVLSPQLHQRNSKNVQFGSDDEGDRQDGENATSPVAHRTRHGHHSPTTSLSPRSRKGAMKKVGAQKRPLKGKEKARDQDAMSEVTDDDDDIIAGDDDQMDEDDEMMEDAPPTPPRRARRSNPSATTAATTAPARNLRKSNKVQQVETPPSDADEESGADSEVEEESEEEEGDTSVEMTSYQRPARQLRNGKIVPLEEEEVEEEEIEEEEETVSEVASDAMEEDQEDEDDVDLMNATSKSLLRCRRDDLIRLCEERQIEGEGTKKELVDALLQWRDQDFDASSGESSAASTASAASNVTARAETKTQALHAALDDEAIHQSKSTPLLMRRGHSCSPEKPQSATRDKADEQEEVNALDLESLQLQDKEIPPEKLTKLEKVGSGGFKDVYKGVYRKKTIAIADIRGHLTEMDIKELGLLRDLRHPNIVHFIGVSIPQEPSTVPVMIVTELCANGDLFDYIRAVPTPPFVTLLQIMLDIAHGIEYLHTRKPLIVHRDIKSSNVLITAQGRAKINDFGLARVRTSTRSVIRSLVGTVNWQAPELWSPHPRYNEKADVYSVGLVYWEMLQWHQPVKRYPYEGLNEHAIYDSVGQKNIRPSTASMGRQWGQEVLHLIGSMWDGDASSRPSMTQVALEVEVLLNAEKEKIKEEKRLRR